MNMRDVPNGMVLGIESDSDGNPFKRVVNQKYRVKVALEIPDGAIKILDQYLEKFSEIGFSISRKICASAERYFSSPLECLQFVESLGRSFKFSLQQRRHAVMGGDFWEDLSLYGLLKILTGENQPANERVFPYNPNFYTGVDIGDD